MKWPFLSSHLVTRPPQQWWEEHSALSPLLAHPSELAGAAGRTSSTGEGDRDSAIPPSQRNAPRQEPLIRGRASPFAPYSCKHISAVFVSNWQEATTDIHNQKGPGKDTQG